MRNQTEHNQAQHAQGTIVGKESVKKLSSNVGSMEQNGNPQKEEALLEQIRLGDHRAAEELIVRYLPLVQSKAAALVREGLEFQDLTQEGLLGLLSAMRSFRPDKGASFRTFANVCITNRLRNVLESFYTEKNYGMRNACSLDEAPLAQTYEAMQLPGPEADVIAGEDARRLHEFLARHLTKTEFHILQGYLRGKSYNQMASELHCSKKAVDNGLQRIRKKIRRLWNGVLHPVDNL